MTKKAFDQIAEGLREAIAIARGDALPFKVHHPIPIPAARHRGAPALIGDQNAPQTETP